MSLEDTIKIQTESTRSLIDAVNRNTFEIAKLVAVVSATLRAPNPSEGVSTAAAAPKFSTTAIEVDVEELDICENKNDEIPETDSLTETQEPSKPKTKTPPKDKEMLKRARLMLPEVPANMPRQPDVPNVKKLSGLPDGERDIAYYERHIQPELLKIGAADRDFLIKHYVNFYRIEAQKRAETAGVEFDESKWSMKDVPPEYWDEIVNRCRQDLDVIAEQKAAKKLREEMRGQPKPPILPAGERTPEFYAQHVRPVLKELMDIDPSRMKDILEAMGHKKATSIPPEEWETLVKKTRRCISDLKGD